VNRERSLNGWSFIVSHRDMPMLGRSVGLDFEAAGSIVWFMTVFVPSNDNLLSNYGLQRVEKRPTEKHGSVGLVRVISSQFVD